METEILAVLNRAEEILREGGQAILLEYSGWFFTRAVALTVLGCVFLTIGTVIFAKFEKWRKNDETAGAIAFAMCILALVGILLIVINVATVTNPEARAIMKLIHDVTN
jgi:hypothetical protein